MPPQQGKVVGVGIAPLVGDGRCVTELSGSHARSSPFYALGDSLHQFNRGPLLDISMSTLLSGNSARPHFVSKFVKAQQAVWIKRSNESKLDCLNQVPNRSGNERVIESYCRTVTWAQGSDRNSESCPTLDGSNSV